jgi:putative transposase
MAVLKDAQVGLGVQELCRKPGISDATFYKWRAKYAGLAVRDVKKLRQLADENRRLKQMGGASAGQPSAESHQRKKLVEPKAKRAAAQWGTERFGLSQRRMCRLLALDRNTLRYCSRRQEEGALRTRIREIAESQRCYGCLASMCAYGEKAGA